MVFAAYLGWWDDEDFGSFTKPEDIMSIVRTHLWNMYYTLKSADSWIAKTGETYWFTDLQAHRVTVPEFARTLFITKKKIDKIYPEGNFEMFPDEILEFTSLSPEQSSVRRYITESLET